jgi:hypothetical protein
MSLSHFLCVLSSWFSGFDQGTTPLKANAEHHYIEKGICSNIKFITCTACAQKVIFTKNPPRSCESAVHQSSRMTTTLSSNPKLAKYPSSKT